VLGLQNAWLTEVINDAFGMNKAQLLVNDIKLLGIIADNA
jgi:hypothetical protein